MKKIEYVLRISYVHFNTPSKLQAMIGFCKKAGIREVQLVPVAYTGGDKSVFPPRAAIAARREALTKIIRRLTDHGISSGYCVVRTFYGASIDGKDYIGFKQPRVDMSGKAGTVHPCPLDAVYLDYIKYFYTELARTGPLTLMVDDDFRYERIPGLGPTCFCPLHLREFRRRYGQKLDREALIRVLGKAAPSRVKANWMEFKRTLLLELAVELRGAVHKVNPNIRVGLMLTSTEISALEGRDHRELVEAFAGGLRPLVRPGQGCYRDSDRLEILRGLTDTVYQSSLMSERTEVQAEVDFYPHSLFNKSAQFGFDYQVKANLACNIKKINIWPFNNDHVVTEKHPFAGMMAGNNKALNRIVRAVPARAVMCGIKVEYSQKAAQLRPQRAGDILKMHMSPIPPLLWRLGIPFTFGESHTVILTKDSFPMRKEKIEEILAGKNVFMDCEALEMVEGMGLAQAIGLRIKGKLPPEAHIEEFMLSDGRNGDAAGRKLRADTMGPVVKLEPGANKWQALTSLRDISRASRAHGLLVSEANGLRTAVWAAPLKEKYWANQIKQAQMQGVLAWLNGGVLPAVVRGAPDVCPVLLEDASTRTRVLSLINASTACADEFTVEFAAKRRPSEYKIRFMNDDGRMEDMPFKHNKKRGVLSLKITGMPQLHPYQVRFMFVTEMPEGIKHGKRL